MQVYRLVVGAGVALALALCCTGEDAHRLEKEFFLRPGVEVQVAEISHEGVRCEFTYKCSGGTGEMWKMSLDLSSSDTALCMVGRPNPPSYLLVSDFGASLESTEFQVQSVEIMAGGRNVPSSQYTIAENKVTPTSSWGGSMELLMLKGIRTAPKATAQPAKNKKKKKKAARTEL